MDPMELGMSGVTGTKSPEEVHSYRGSVAEKCFCAGRIGSSKSPHGSPFYSAVTMVMTSPLP
jgi:hypothetical protein